MITIVTDSPEQTEKAAEIIAKWLPDQTILAMFGGMGMGKTAFVRGLARGLGIDSDVSSPTFSIVHEYAGSRELYHFDMYRVKNWDDLETTGFYEYQEKSGILAVEWSENIENALPQAAVRAEFSLGSSEGERVIRIQGLPI